MSWTQFKKQVSKGSAQFLSRQSLQTTFPPIDLRENDIEIMYQLHLSSLLTWRSVTGGAGSLLIYTVPSNLVFVIDFVSLQTYCETSVTEAEAYIATVDPANLTAAAGFIAHTLIQRRAAAEFDRSDIFQANYSSGLIIPSDFRIVLYTEDQVTLKCSYIIHGYLAKPLREIRTFHNNVTEGF